MKLRVFHDHQLLDEYSVDHGHRVTDAGDLEVLAPGFQYSGGIPTGTTVKTYPAGTWHACGINFACGALTYDPNCQRCSSAAELTV